jgi:hypothetical protein
VLALSVLLRSWFLSVPLERDEGEYAYIAWLMDHGGAPYRDAFDQKTPGTFIAYFAIMKLFGFSIEGIHVGAALWCAGTAWFIHLTGKRLHSPSVGLLGAAIFSVAAISPAVDGTAANTELFMALPTAAAAFVASGFVGSRRSAACAAVCGFLVGCAALFKQVALADGGFFFLVIALAAGRSEGAGRAVITCIVAFAAGALAALVLPLAYLAWQGALSHFVNDTMSFNAGYLGVVPLSDYPARLMVTLRDRLVPFLWPYLSIGALGAVVALVGKAEARAARFFLPGWLLFSFLGVVPGGAFRSHYFVQMLAPLSLLGGLALVVGTRAIGWAPARFGARVAVAVLPLALAFRPFFALTPDQVSEALYAGSPFVESKAVARVISENSDPDERVFVFGSEPQILFYAGRRSATRYILTYPVMMKVPGAAERQVEMFEEVRDARPKAIVVVMDPMSHLIGPWSNPYAFDQLKALAPHYDLIYRSAATDGARAEIGVYLRKP